MIVVELLHDLELMREAAVALKRLVPEHVVCNCRKEDEAAWCQGVRTITKLEQRLLQE